MYYCTLHNMECQTHDSPSMSAKLALFTWDAIQVLGRQEAFRQGAHLLRSCALFAIGCRRLRQSLGGARLRPFCRWLHRRSGLSLHSAAWLAGSHRGTPLQQRQQKIFGRSMLQAHGPR